MTAGGRRKGSKGERGRRERGLFSVLEAGRGKKKRR